MGSQEGCVDQAPFKLRLAVGGALLFQGVMSDEAVLLTLGCFCTYTSLASTMVGEDNFSRAIVIATCGLATMLLGELAQAYMLPLQVALASTFELLPVCGTLFGKTALNGLLAEVWALRAVLQDITALVN